MLKEMLKDASPTIIKVKPKKMMETVEPSKEYFPNFCLSIKDLPEIEKWEVGKDYAIALKITLTNKSLHEGKEKTGDGSFDIEEIGVLGEDENEPSKETKDYFKE